MLVGFPALLMIVCEAVVAGKTDTAWFESAPVIPATATDELARINCDDWCKCGWAIRLGVWPAGTTVVPKAEVGRSKLFDPTAAAEGNKAAPPPGDGRTDWGCCAAGSRATKRPPSPAVAAVAESCLFAGTVVTWLRPGWLPRELTKLTLFRPSDWENDVASTRGILLAAALSIAPFSRMLLLGTVCCSLAVFMTKGLAFRFRAELSTMMAWFTGEVPAVGAMSTVLFLSTSPFTSTGVFKAVRGERKSVCSTFASSSKGETKISELAAVLFGKWNPNQTKFQTETKFR